MAIFKNTATQFLDVFAFADAGHASLDPGEPVTGDAANITATIEQDSDGTHSATNDANPTEISGGFYRFTLTQAETNADKLFAKAVSATAGVQVVICPSPVIYTRPPNFPALGIESDGDLTQVNSLAGHTAQTGDSFARLGAPAGASVSADVAALPTQADITGGAYSLDTDANGRVRVVDGTAAGEISLTNGLLDWNAAWDAEVQSEVADALAVFWTSPATLVDLVWDEATSQHTSTDTTGRYLMEIRNANVATTGSVAFAGSPTAAAFNTSLTEADNFWNDTLLTFTSGTLAGQSRPIASFLNASGAMTFDEAFTAAPAFGDDFQIRASHVHPVSQIADGVWEEATAGHVGAGTFGKLGADVLEDTNELQTNQGDWLTATGFSTLDAAGVRTAVGLATANLDTQLATAQADLDILTGADGVTIATLQANYAPAKAGDQMDLVDAPNATAVTAIQAGLATSSALSTAQTAITAIKAITDAIGPTAAANLARSLGAAGCVFFTAQTGTLSTTQATTNLTEATADHYKGRIITWITGDLSGQATDITAYNGTGGLFTFTALTEAPANGDTGIIT